MRARRRKRILAISGAATTIAATLIILTAPAALAHEEREVARGRFHVAVGFGTEPAYAGQPNSVQMFLNDANDKPVTDLGDTLKISVKFGSQTMDLGTMEPDFEVGEFGTPGDYRAWFIPTRSGPYTFIFTGKIGSTDIGTETFTSAKDTFASVTDPGTVEFPVKDPTNAELAGRITAETPRLEAAASSAQDAADSAKTVGIIGVVVAAIALIVAVAAIVTRPKRGST
jgi:hypothetical protein